MLAFIKREPALFLGAIGAAIALAVGLGFRLTGEQVGLIMAFVQSLVALVTRSQVVSSTMSDGLIKTAVSMPPTASVSQVKEQHSEETKGSP